MGTVKKESARRARQTNPSDKTNNIRTKGENFYRSAKRVKTLNMFKNGGPTRNAQGKITQAAAFQNSTPSAPNARIEPHRKWFTNTRVIGQDALEGFRRAVEERQGDPFSYLLKRNKLPMSLIRDGKGEERKDGVVQHQAKMRIEGEKFGEAFGPKARRKRVRLSGGVGSLEELAGATQKEQEGYEEKTEQDGGQSYSNNDTATSARREGEGLGGTEEENTIAREPIFSKGQSKRIWNELYKVIDSSDVVIHVLDARDPLGTRCRSVEKYIREEAPHKHLLFLLNKCDLVPTGVAARWVRHLNTEYPTLAFHASLTNSFGKGTLISLLRQFSSLHSSRKQISVGFIGYPNTGKSSIINTLRKKKVCKTAPLPGETKVWQYITLMKRIYLIDCPGIVPPGAHDGPEEVLLRGSVRVENVENPAQYVPAVLERCQRRHLERTYGVRGWAVDSTATVDGGDVEARDEGKDIDNIVGGPKSNKQKTEEATRFLELLARKGGRLLKGGEADLDGVAKMVLNDFLRGKIPWFCPPPPKPEDDAERLEDGQAEGRDVALGFTHGKRKRELELEDAGTEIGEVERNEDASEFESFEDEDKDEDHEEDGSGSESLSDDDSSGGDDDIEEDVDHGGVEIAAENSHGEASS